jgi:uncharacterized protein YciI
MLYLRICFDKKDSGELRGKMLKSHREYIGSHVGIAKDGVKIVQAGPMCAGDDLSNNIGSFLVVEANSFEAALRFHEADPFTRAGLFDDPKIVRWDRHIGNENQTEYVP